MTDFKRPGVSNEPSRARPHVHWLAPHEARQELAYESLRFVLAPVLRRLVSRIEFEGMEHVPTAGPALLVGNHRSVLDPMLIALGLERHVHFVADSWMGHMVIAPLFKAAGILFLPSAHHRTPALLRAGAEALADGQLLGIFPEGMDNFLTTTPPRSVGCFHSAFARLWFKVRDLEVPIIPIAVVGSCVERRIRLPGAYFHALDPCDRRRGRRPVSAVFYESALIRCGEPVTVPPGLHGEQGVDLLTERVRDRVMRLMEI